MTTFSGLGALGYTRVARQTLFGTAVTTSMVDLEVLPGTDIVVTNKHIINESQVGQNRMIPISLGREMLVGQLMSYVKTSTIGTLLNYFLGAPTTIADTDFPSLFKHTWNTNTSLSSIRGSFFSWQHRKGVDTPVLYQDCKIVKMMFESDNENNITTTAEVIGGEVNTTPQTAPTSFTYTSDQPLNFTNLTLSLSDGITTVVPNADSINLSVDMGYQREKFHLGNRSTRELRFTETPTCMVEATIDADSQLVTWARARTPVQVQCLMSGASNQALSFFFPVTFLNEDLNIDNSNEFLKLSLTAMTRYAGAIDSALITGSPISSELSTIGGIVLRNSTTSYA